jgi:hypothetical protein
MHGVLFTPTFERHARDAGLDEDEIIAIASWLAENPLAGDLMQGAGGARKVRFAREGKGKSGGYRTIHYYGGDDVPLFLLALIDKRNELAKLLPRIGKAYRESVKERANPEREPR